MGYRRCAEITGLKIKKRAVRVCGCLEDSPFHPPLNVAGFALDRDWDLL